MFVVSFHEQSHKFNLHNKGEGGKFDSYLYTKDSRGDITSGVHAIPVNEVIIFGYLSKHNKTIIASCNMYYGDCFAVMELDDKTWEHLIAEWGTASTLFRTGIIFAEKKQADAIAKAKSRLLGGGIFSLDTGSRPLDINDKYGKKALQHKPLSINERI